MLPTPYRVFCLAASVFLFGLLAGINVALFYPSAFVAAWWKVLGAVFFAIWMIVLILVETKE